MRGVDATVKLATAAPDGVNRSSGSAVRFPTTVMVVSPATVSSSFRAVPRRSGSGCHERVLAEAYAGAPRRGSTARPRLLVLVGAHHLGAQHRLVEAQLAVELGHRRRLGFQVDHNVDAFGVLGDLVSQPALTPDVDLVYAPAVLADDIEERLQRRSNGTFVERGVKNDHDFVGTHGNLTTSSGLCGHGRSVAGESPASATAQGYRKAG